MGERGGGGGGGGGARRSEGTEISHLGGIILWPYSARLVLQVIRGLGRLVPSCDLT